MTSTHFDRFLAEAVTRDRETDGGLSGDELYGLYTSWCLINSLTPEPPQRFWDVLGEKGIAPGNNGLAMTGPAATDYIVASAPDLV
ncbi:hypothetical protein [Arthrobacter sp. ISL-72]|uniref:hypothetical protein n=1 Tax=Arthrobacter sp. ISL-72 TaxID=2819114 RepID=UPI001BEAD698|nr:hypothetical protein [Arthrobacter sp. ISL-72]MBT2595912.1 hypothetical protein [Arthrobacter sp. ISL-72]